MKKGCIIVGAMSVGMLMGYGAWCLYKKMMPECANEIKKDMKNAFKELEKIPEDMKRD